MKALCFVFPIPVRFFEDMLEVCVQLQDYYQNAPVYPLYVATMKRSYCFENAQGAYGEFECGDHFLVFQGEFESFTPDAFFQKAFPTPELLQIVHWEEVPLEMGIVAVDSLLESALANMGIGINLYSENKWMMFEDYSSFVALSRTS